jgi:hypothetical protein
MNKLTQVILRSNVVKIQQIQGLTLGLLYTILSVLCVILLTDEVIYENCK